MLLGQILGFDILLMKNLKPVLLEVNSNPSMRIEHEQEVRRDLIHSNIAAIVIDVLLIDLSVCFRWPQEFSNMFPVQWTRTWKWAWSGTLCASWTLVTRKLQRKHTVEVWSCLPSSRGVLLFCFFAVGLKIPLSHAWYLTLPSPQRLPLSSLNGKIKFNWAVVEIHTWLYKSGG